MKPERIDYDALIESLADGVEVDWAALDGAATSDSERRRYGNLRLVAKMAQLHRTLALEEAASMADSGASAPAVETPSGEVWGHLQIHERIAGGSFGDVFIARDSQLDREVALKLLRPSLNRPLERLLDEGRTLAKLRHPNVVTVHGADVRDGRAGLWMELIDGQTLAAWTRAHGPMGAGEATAVAVDLCRALAAVHNAGLVHGDIKAQNVMREEGGRIVLMDFGAGHVEGADAAAGTPLYLAPEVLNRQPATSRSDIYSLGVLLFNLLTGTYPCLADDVDNLKAAHADGVRLYLRDLRPELPGTLVDTIERALDPNPSRRFASAGEMERALTSEVKPEPVRGFWPPSKTTIAASLALAAGIVLAVLLPGFFRPILPTNAAIAVLPFVDASGSADHLMSGLTTDVVREMQTFNVQVKRAGRDVSMAGVSLTDKLGAAAFVRGSASRTGTRTSVDVAVDELGGKVLWSRTYTVDDAELPRLGATVAADVAKALKIEKRENAPAMQQTNYRAYDAYLRGRAEAARRTDTALALSLKHFDEAIKFDPAYAEPWAGKADTYLTMGIPAFGKLSPLEARRMAKESLLKAVELNPHLVEAQTSLAFSAFVQDYDWAAAENGFKDALALNPQYAQAHHWYAELLNSLGKPNDAMVEIRKAQALEPLSLLYNRDVAWHLFHQERYTDAIEQLQVTLGMDPDYSASLTLLARALAAVGQDDEALAQLEKARPRISNAVYLGFRAPIEAAAGRRRQAEETMAMIRALPSEAYASPYYLALAHAALGQNSAALDELERSYLQQDPNLVSVNIDPRLKPLHDEPRFKVLITKMRLSPTER